MHETHSGCVRSRFIISQSFSELQSRSVSGAAAVGATRLTAALERRVGDLWGRGLTLRGNGLRSSFPRRQGKDWHDGVAKRAGFTAREAVFA